MLSHSCAIIHPSPELFPSSQSEVKVKAAQSCPALCNPRDYTVHGILQARILEWVTFPFSRGSSQPRGRTQVFPVACGFFTSWVTRKPKNTGVGSLSLLQQIFPTQGSNPSLSKYKQILYHLSHPGRLILSILYHFWGLFFCCFIFLFFSAHILCNLLYISFHLVSHLMFWVPSFTVDTSFLEFPY